MSKKWPVGVHIHFVLIIIYIRIANSLFSNCFAQLANFSAADKHAKRKCKKYIHTSLLFFIMCFVISLIQVVEEELIAKHMKTIVEVGSPCLNF